MLAAACGSDDTDETDDTPRRRTAADEEADTEESAFPDLDGRTVTVGVENAYSAVQLHRRW